MGASVAWWLKTLAPRTSVAVVERDSTFGIASTPRSVGGVRQQFSNPENVLLSLHSAQFIKEGHKAYDTAKADVPFPALLEYGYLFLATEGGAATLRENHVTQRHCGAEVSLLDSAALAARFPWLNTASLSLGSMGERWEGFFDPWQLLQWFNAQARAVGVDFIEGGVEGVGLVGGRVSSVTVAPTSARGSAPTTLHCGALVNACGAWSGRLAALAGVQSFPVQPRRRVVFVVTSEQPLPEGTPLVVDPCGVYFRPEGPAPQRRFLCGVSPEVDPDSEGTGADLETTASDHSDLFEGVIWPALAHRVPQFASLRVQRSWSGCVGVRSRQL